METLLPQINGEQASKMKVKYTYKKIKIFQPQKKKALSIERQVAIN